MIGPGEIGRRLDMIAADIRELRSEVVHRDVYEAQQMAMQERLTRLERENGDLMDDRRGTRKLVIGAALSTMGVIAVDLASRWFH